MLKIIAIGLLNKVHLKRHSRSFAEPANQCRHNIGWRNCARNFLLLTSGPGASNKFLRPLEFGVTFVGVSNNTNFARFQVRPTFIDIYSRTFPAPGLLAILGILVLAKLVQTLALFAGVTGLFLFACCHDFYSFVISAKEGLQGLP